MNWKLAFAPMFAVALATLPACADESVLTARDSTSSEQSSSSSSRETLLAVNVATSRGVPTSAAAEEKPPVARPVVAATSRSDGGAVYRSTISEVLPETSYIVLKTDTTPTRYRYTKATQFIDEKGRVLSADMVKPGTNATLHFTKTQDDVVLTTVIVNNTTRPMAGAHSQALAEVQNEP